MKVISKKITRNNLLSKLPSIVPAIMDYWELPNLYACGNPDVSEKYYSYDNAVKRAHEHNIRTSELIYGAEFVNFSAENVIDFYAGNYGLIASDIIIPQEIDSYLEPGIPFRLADSVSDYTDLYVNIPVEDERRRECIEATGEDRYEEFYNLSWPLDSNFKKYGEEGYRNDSIPDPHYEYIDRYYIYRNGWSVKVLTQHTLNKWYTFFVKYHMLIDNPEYERSYSSATDYYEHEFKEKNDDTRKEYEELDEIYASRGGAEMYYWISNNLVMQYVIPEEFSDEWKETKLYYPQALMWYWWFKERTEKYNGLYTIEGCTSKQDIDCCDCTEYIKKGGYNFYSKLAEWVENLPEIDTSYATRSASVNLTINLQNSIDDLGEMSILSSDWENEVDYHNTLTEKGYNTNGESGGTVVNRPYIIDADGNYVTLSDTFIIKNPEAFDKHIGYEPANSANYYENTFKKDDWYSYTDVYMNQNMDKFASDYKPNYDTYEAVTSYTFSPVNGKVVYNPQDITTEVPIIGRPCVCINGNTYDIIDGKYVQLCYSTSSIANVYLKSNTELPIYKDGDLEYTIYNGKRKYVQVDSNGVERVYFLKDSNCYDKGCRVSSGRYIIYDGNLLFVDDSTNSIIMEDVDTIRYYQIADNYFDYSNKRFYIVDGKIMIQNDVEYSEDLTAYIYNFRELTDYDLNLLDLVKIETNWYNEYVTLYHKYGQIDCSIVSGYTSSKLELLRRKEITVDELGNELPGHFKSIVNIDKESPEENSIYNNPYDQCTLDILYRVGEVSELKNFYQDKETNEKFFFGNIIDKIKFYYANATGEILTDDEGMPMEEYVTDDNALTIISDLEYRLSQLEKEYDGYNMFCDITYYMGTTLHIIDGMYKLPDGEQYDRGVKYVDTLFVSRDTGLYYLADGNSFTFNYYSLYRHIKDIYVSDFNSKETSDISYFEFEPWLYHIVKGDYNKDVLEQVNGYRYTTDKHWEKNNNNIAAPLFRQEFNLASSMSQNVDANIYIDRGINAAFEKHLKLQEIRTMEALENYGNGYFKINKF